MLDDSFILWTILVQFYFGIKKMKEISSFLFFLVGALFDLTYLCDARYILSTLIIPFDMKHLFMRMLLAELLMIGAVVSASAQVSMNLATKVTDLKASTNNGQLTFINDNGRVEFWSGFHGTDFYGQYEYIELTWDRINNITSADVYWAVSGDTIDVPIDAYMSYWNGTDWVWGQSFGDVVNQTSRVEVNISTNKIRIYMKGMKACGVREVRVIGMQGEYDPTVMYQWPTYPDVMNYDFRNDYPNGFPAPTKLLPENVGQVGTRIKGWWAFAWGKNRNRYVTDAAIDSLLSRMDNDFRFFRDVMGWLPDKRSKNGFYSTVYLYGSGLTIDNADSTALGGWQGSTWYNGESWPMVHLSYYPVACFDSQFTYDSFQGKNVTDQAFQMGACVHEGIHSMLADLEGCKKSVWFHESSDNWLMSEAEQRRQNISTPTSMGFLSAASVIAPFMPIDCYSGWLQDGSFGGPTADGVNMYGDKGQLCTWRNLLGGVQYSEYFPNALSQMLGNGSIPWIWQNCRDYILEGMGKVLGDESMRSLLVEYNARRAMVDVGKWNTAITSLLDNNWLLDIGPEGNTSGGNWKGDIEHWRATCYANMSKCDEVDSAGWWKPEYRTTPGWSASNQIPLHIEGVQGNIVRLYFKPIGANMTCQLCYRSKRGKVYYSHPVQDEGIVSIELKEVPANQVIIAVVSNTDYIYKGEETRKAHYDYRLKMMDNVYQPADAKLKWYQFRNTITDGAFVTDINEVSKNDGNSGAMRFSMTLQTNKVKCGDSLPLYFTGVARPWIQVRLHSLDGETVYAQSFRYDGLLHIPSFLTKGLYIVESQDGKDLASAKLLIE